MDQIKQDVPFKIGVLQLSMEPLDETVRMAKACEQAGFDIFWLAEAYPWWRKHGYEARSSTAITAVIARETKRIQIGWGIISPYTRHPVQIAMEARVLQDAAGDGRFLLGLGASKIFMKEIGEGEKGKEVGPATVMKESLEIVKAMLSGEEVNYHGKAFDASAPALKPEAHVSRKSVPMYIAGTGPAMQRLAGSHSDGLLTASITTPEFVKYSRRNMEEGARKAGREPSAVSVMVAAPAHIGPRDKVRDRVRWFPALVSNHVVDLVKRYGEKGLPADLTAYVRNRPGYDYQHHAESGSSNAAFVDDESVDRFCVTGEIAEHIEKLRHLAAIGVRQFNIYLMSGEEERILELYGERIIPALSGVTA